MGGPPGKPERGGAGGGESVAREDEGGSSGGADDEAGWEGESDECGGKSAECGGEEDGTKPFDGPGEVGKNRTHWTDL